MSHSNGWFAAGGNMLAAVSVLAWSGMALASGFAIQEQNGSGLGNAFAGGAAIADDAGTIFTNPAGMARLQGRQTSVAVSLICPSIKFRNGNSEPAALQPLGGNGGDAGSCRPVPAVYLSLPVGERWWAGVGVNAPFGLTTEYDDGWVGRFQGLKSDVQTINLNPAIAYRASDRWSFGVGINWQRIDAELTSRVNYAGDFALGVEQGVLAGQIPAAAVPELLSAVAGLESGARVKGHDDAWGWNVGSLLALNDRTRIGLAYRSKIDYTVRGSVNFSNPSPGPLPAALEPIGAAVAAAVDAQLADGPVRLQLEVPAIANLSLVHSLSDRWQLMADAQFTGWSSVQGLRIVRSTNAVLSNTPELFRDTWRFSVGANYAVSDDWTLRAGVAYDQSPVRDAERTPRLPDSDRRWLSLGARYDYSPHLTLDAAMTYIDVKRTAMLQNEGSTAANGLIDGSYGSDVTLIALQFNYGFD